MERIDFESIARQTARDYKIRAITAEIEKVGGPKNVLITDCLSNKDRDGLLVMRVITDVLKHDPTARYKLQCLKNKWGKPVNPGEVIEWKFERKIRDMFGKKITNRQYKEYLRRGERHQVEVWHEATVDKKQCIDVHFLDAAMLLDTRGIHFTSMQPLTTMPETEREVTRDFYDKDYAKVIGRQHYWLYCECPPWVYAELPEVESLKDTQKEMRLAVDGKSPNPQRSK